ncbi:ulp1 protease family, C-terminal catalytic domain-containing protein [Tanacetum coccineum]
MSAIIVFLAFRVVSYNERRLQELGNSLKMNNIALDFVMVGSHINATRLKAFVAAVNNNDNSHILYVASAPSICQAILSPHIFPHFEEDLRRYAARGTVSIDMLREAIKKDVAMYCDENVKPQEMNKKDNQSAKPKKKPVSQLVSLSLKSISCLISESETEEESGQSEEESSNDDKGIEDDSEDKMYINENKKIRTRNPLKSLSNIMSKLTDAQIGTLKDMGFGSFIGYKINRVPTALARWLLLNYDPRTYVLEAGDVKIKITSQIVHDIFGLPMGGLATIKPSDVAKRILEREDDAGRIFKLNFLVLFVTQMMNSTKCGTVNQTFLTCLKKGMDIKKLDWCGYLLKCLKRTKTLWKGGLLNGPSTFLTVLYAQKCMPMVLKRSSTAVITKWTTRKLIMLQKEMIASNKKIIAPDTNIETHEIIAAETTPEKERMTKSKIIAAKNTVSQSPIKAVKLGDISGKASNGISNTPKDAQVTESGLRNKFTMLEVLMNEIACDLAKAIQQHPGDEEIEYIKLQWKETLLKRASEMNVKDKDLANRYLKGKNNQEMEVDLEKTDAHNTIDAVDRGMEVEEEKNNQEMEVDLVKTDAHKTIDADKQGASRLKDVNKSECTNWAKHSKISALTPKSLSSFDAQFNPVKVVSTMEEPLPVNDIPSFDLGLTPTPPDVNCEAQVTAKKAKEQESTTIASATTVSNTTKFEVVSNSVKDRSSVLLLNDAPSFDLGLTPTSPYVNLHTDTGITIHVGVINMWSQVCNFEERLRSQDSMRRLFCHSSMISEKTLNEKNNVKALSYFIDDMEFVMKSAKVDNIYNIDMVFFPVLLAKSHYYLLVFNLKTPKIEILDNSKNGINVSLDDRYGESFQKLKKLFIEYLSYSEHRSWKSMKKAVCERIEMS